MKRTSSIVSAVLLAVLGACAAPTSPSPTELSGTLESAEVGTIKNLHVIDGIYLSGQPSQADLALARDRGIETVLSIRKDGEVDWDEGAEVSRLGMTWVHVGWNGPDELTDEVFATGRKLLSSMERPVLFHCGSANRVGAMWIPWRVLDGGLSLDDAVAEAKVIGLRTEAYVDKASDYVSRNR